MFRKGILLAIFCLLLFVSGIFLLSACNYPQTKPIAATVTPTREIIIQQATQTYTPTATPVVIPPTATPVATAPVFHLVEPGQTLSEIANLYNLSVDDLVRANHLYSADWIMAGQQLLIAVVPITVPEATVQRGKQIIVVLSTQRAYAYEDGVLAHPEFTVATGVAAYPTVTGNYAVYIKLESTRMTGPGYDIPDVPWTMYFHLGYGLHGAPWNNNLGTPGSHGCVNMSVEDADWLFHWAEVGTPVLVIP